MRRALSTRLRARRLHRAQRHDLAVSARFRLGLYRWIHRRFVVEFHEHATLFPPPGGLSASSFLAFLSQLTADRFNPSGHGWNGWLESEVPLPQSAFGDRALMSVIRETIRADLRQTAAPQGRLAPGSAQFECCASDSALSLLAKPIPTISACKAGSPRAYPEIPLSTFSGRRRGARERVLAAARMHSLHLECDALATQSPVGRRQARSRRRISEGKKPLSRIARRNWRGRHTAMRKRAHARSSLLPARSIPRRF